MIDAKTKWSDCGDTRDSTKVNILIIESAAFCNNRNIYNPIISNVVRLVEKKI
jgi:hypothetical protein